MTALHWTDSGPRSPHAIVLLHSLGTDGRIWTEQVRALTDDGHRVVVPDARGHGRSVWEAPATLETWTADLHDVLDAAGVERALLCGLSMGGVQALAFALDHQDRLDGLILADTFAGLDPEVAEAKVAGLAGTARDEGMAALADGYLRDTFTGPVPAERAAWVRDAIAGMSADAYVSSAEACFGVQLADRLSELAVPTLVLWGDRDAKTPRALAEQLATGIAGAELAEVPGAGHLSNLEAPRAFTEAVAAFAAGVGAPARSARTARR